MLYATAEQLSAWFDGVPTPANAPSLLRSASLLVRAETVGTVYTTDTDGAPSDPVVRQAFADATCAQVMAWSVAGIDPAGGGVATSAPVRSKKLGSGAIDYDTSVNSSVAMFQARRNVTTSLCYEAWMILTQAGLRVVVSG